MADYLLDTNILKYWYTSTCPEHSKVLRHLNLARQPDPQTGYISRIFISVVTLGEIEYGHRVVTNPDIAKQTAYTQFVQQQCPSPLELSSHVAQQYGELRAWLFNNCSPNMNRAKARRVEELVDPTTARELGVQENDLWIAAHAMTHNLTLVSHDSRGNFGKLLQAFRSTLHVEDWAQ